jgi:hypothetical protein
VISPTRIPAVTAAGRRARTPGRAAHGAAGFGAGLAAA